MTQPNLFSFATSELSQDAFICWLLSWASPELANIDKELHKCSLNFINSLFKKHGKESPLSIEKVTIKKQDSNIDVVCIINDIFVILIEDKTSTSNHSGQLLRYLNTINTRNFEQQNILPIYFKTGDQDSYEDIHVNQYQPYLREDLLKILNQYSGSNNILKDYRSHIQEIENAVQSYQSRPINSWCGKSWTGFYLRLQQELGTGRWRKVANPSGGFWGFWWCQSGDRPYLQLEEDRLCFKIRIKNKSELKPIRDKWYTALMAEGFKHGIELERPPLRLGGTITICRLAGSYRETLEEVICIEKTINKLKTVEMLLNATTVE